jgi:hypothetical protein
MTTQESMTKFPNFSKLTEFFMILDRASRHLEPTALRSVEESVPSVAVVYDRRSSDEESRRRKKESPLKLKLNRFLRSQSS